MVAFTIAPPESRPVVSLSDVEDGYQAHLDHGGARTGRV